MTDQGLIASKELPPPAARSIYTATERGRSVIPVMRSLAKWGVPLLEEPADDQYIRPWTCANAMIAAYYDSGAAAGIDERYLLRIDGEDITLSSVKGRSGPHETPDLTLESTARVWVDIRQGRLRFREAISEGRVTKNGSARALTNFRRIFAVP